MSSLPDLGRELDLSEKEVVAAAAQAWLRGRPNPFEGLVRPQRPDDRFLDLHVPALLREPRELLLSVIDSYRRIEYRSASDLGDSRVVTVVGPRGSGKTHMLEALAQRTDGRAQVLVRPTYYEAQAPFEDFLLEQLVGALLTEDPVRGGRPFLDLAAQLTRRLVLQALREMSPADRLLADRPTNWQRLRLLWGGGERRSARWQRLADGLADRAAPRDLTALAIEHGVRPEFVLRLVEARLQQRERGDELLARVRRGLYRSMARAVLLGDGDALASFLESPENVAGPRPFLRADLVRQQLHALVEACALVQLPVVFALDNLEGSLAPRGQFDPGTARAFMDSLAQAVDATRGIIFLLFAEEGLFQEVRRNTHQFALDRIDQGVPLHARGPVDRVDLRPPTFDELRDLIAERVGRHLQDFPGPARPPVSFPFAAAFLDDLANRRGLGLRNAMLRLRDEYARVIYGKSPAVKPDPPAPRLDYNFVLEEQWRKALQAADQRLQNQPNLNQSRGPLHDALSLVYARTGPIRLDGWELSAVTRFTSESNAPYGVVSLFDWQPLPPSGAPTVRVMVGFLLAGGGGMRKDLESKFALFDDPVQHANHLVVLWQKPAANALISALPAATGQVWADARRKANATLRPLTDEDLRGLLAFPDWQRAIQDAEPPVPEDVLRTFIQQRYVAILQRLLPPGSEAHAN